MKQMIQLLNYCAIDCMTLMDGINKFNNDLAEVFKTKRKNGLVFINLYR